MAAPSPITAGVYILNTDDIISALDGMVDVTKEAVNAAMMLRGFVCGRNTHGTFGRMLMTRTD